MHGGYIFILVVMSIIGACLVTVAYQSAVENKYDEKGITRILKALFTTAYIATVVFLGYLFEGMTDINQYECIDQGEVTISKGNSTTPATYREEASALYLGDSIGGYARCRLYWSGEGPCTVPGSMASSLFLPGCGCTTTRIPTSYVQKFRFSRTFILKDVKKDTLTSVTLITGYVYETEDAARQAAQSATLPIGSPLYMEPSDAVTQTISNLWEFESKFVNIQEKAAKKATGSEGSMIAGSIASGLLGLGILYGIVEYYRDRKSTSKTVFNPYRVLESRRVPKLDQFSYRY